MSVYGERIKKLRESTGLDQPKLAFRCGWKRSRISNYENGIRTPKIDDVIKISQALQPFLGDNQDVYIFTGSTVLELAGMQVNADFTPDLAVKEFKSVIGDAVEFGRLKLEPGFKIMDMVESFSKSCGSYLSRKNNQRSA